MISKHFIAGREAAAQAAPTTRQAGRAQGWRVPVNSDYARTSNVSKLGTDGRDRDVAHQDDQSWTSDVEGYQPDDSLEVRNCNWASWNPRFSASRRSLLPVKQLERDAIGITEVDNEAAAAGVGDWRVRHGQIL
jgi:hypothetical protein